ncbi:MAG: UDP-N-acetylmuramoyl-tripeptide--D-alanyl-D-alanine ligase [Flavobacterium sp.]|nr:UDP-N-acetylmuramoyl-tripeptide--D-alanyl-D-alanine ligase [Flavobacterium sp.]
MQTNQIHHIFLKCSSLVIDTRKITKNSIFLAIKGERFDANTFAQEALNLGASYVIIDNATHFIDERTILVNDSLKTLQKLALYHRRYLNLTIIALTGSNGKTTTKELIQVVLSKKYNTKATVGNLNNHIGVPLTLLSFTKETEIGIVEMGANHQKEIEFLCNLALPDFGYITNYGKAHLEGFGGVEGVIKGKSEMYDYILNHNKMVFVNLDDEIQVRKSADLTKITFGLNNEKANLNIKKVTANPFVEIIYDQIVIKSALIGLYNSNNINVSILIGKYFKIEDFQIKIAIESYVPDNNRSQLLKKGTNKIILDAYNANPSSMKVAIENFIQIENPYKILFLGDMFGLGDESIIEHKAIISMLMNQKCFTYFIGKYFYDNKIENSNFLFFKNYEDLAVVLKNSKIENANILIKGSRGMALERILEIL